jgi:hypothetical protein
VRPLRIEKKEKGELKADDAGGEEEATHGRDDGADGPFVLAAFSFDLRIR